MDYQEAIEYMRKELHKQCVNSEGQDAYIIAISAMLELQKYKQLGTLEELKLIKTTHLTGVELAQISCMLKQLAEYEKIGTLEEVRDAIERQQAKKPVVGADVMVGRYDGGNPIWGTDYVCAECGMGIAPEYVCCPYCGNAIDWSEEI